MNRKNLADYFHRLGSLKHLAETNRKLATKLTSAYAESYSFRIKRTPRKRILLRLAQKIINSFYSGANTFIFDRNKQSSYVIITGFEFKY